MAEERKKPKIDLKTRIPSKTVKGLSPSTGGGAIPPPPGAVPAPPPDLLGRRTQPPKVSVDPNDPLGAAKMEGGSSPQQQQIVVVEAAQPEGVAGHASKRGVFFAIVGVVLLVGAGIGFLVGSGSSDRGRKGKATGDVKDLQAKVVKTTASLEALLATLKQAQSEVDNDGVKQETIDALKNWKSGFSAADLQSIDLAYIGPDNALKIVGWASSVYYIDQLAVGLTKGNALENANAQVKAFSIPAKQSKWGVTLEKPSKDVPLTVASLVDFGEALDLKTKVDLKDPKAPKLNAKSAQLDVWADGTKGDFVGGEKNYVSAILGSDWLKACPVRAQALGYTRQGIGEVVTALEGAGDIPGVIKPGKDLGDKLKGLAK